MALEEYGHSIYWIDEEGDTIDFGADSLQARCADAGGTCHTLSCAQLRRRRPNPPMTYDLVVIGTGPGGYVCAIRAAQLGLHTAVVEKRKTHGGTCLNIGCIPSKALLHASERFEEAKRHLGEMGISVSAPKLDLKTMMAFKDEGVEGNVKGVEFLLKKNKIDAFHGSRAHRRRRTDRGQGGGRLEPGRRDEEHRHRDRIGRDPPARHRDRREGGRLLGGRARARQGAEEAPGHRRGRDRARARLGLAPARRGGRRRRVPRPRPARHGPRDRTAVPAHPGEARDAVQAVLEGDEGRADEERRQGDDRAGGRRRGRDRRCRRGPGLGRTRPLHRRARA